MPSARARLTNAILHVTTKRRWRADTRIESVRARAARIDGRLGERSGHDPGESWVIGGVPCKWYGTAGQATHGTLLYLHGGAWCLHLPNLYRRFATRLSALTGLRVLLPDYRLAPEYPFPAAVDDCLAVYRGLVTSDACRRPLYVAGDSAGGSLAAVTLMRARDDSLPLPAAAVLLSPSTDITMSGASHDYNERLDPMFSALATRLLPDLYCPSAERDHPWLSPLFGDWRGLPPLLFHVGSTEMLLDDSVRAHDRARAAGVNARLRVWRELPHVFQLFGWLPEARLALDDIAAFLSEHRTANVWGAATMAPGGTTSPAIPDSYARSGA